METRGKAGRFLALAAMAILGAGRALGACGTFDLCSTGYHFNNSASLLSSYVFQMAPNSAWQSGTAWNPNTIDLSQDFDFSFDMNFGSNSNGADGMTFTLQNDPRGLAAFGESGGELGIGGAYAGSGPVENPVSPSVSVEFDSFQNTSGPNNNDPSYDHIMVDENGDVVHGGTCSTASGGVITTATGSCPVQASQTNTNIKDGLWHRVEISWTASTHVLKVTFDGSLRLTDTDDLVGKVFGGTSCVYFGFTGATGGLSNQEQVRLTSCLPSPTVTPTATPSPTPYPPGCGTPVFVQAAMIGHGCIGAGPNFSFPYGIPAQANELLVVRVESSATNGGTLTNVAYGGVAMTLQSSASASNLPSNPDFLTTYYLANPPTGAQNFTFTNSSSSQCNWNIAAEVWSNVNVSNPVGPTNGAQSGSSDSTGTDTITITTSGPASLVSVFMASDQANSSVPTGGPGQTSLGLSTASMACCEGVYGDYKVVNGPGTYSMTYNVSQANRPYCAQPIEIEGAPSCFSPTDTPVLSPTPSPTCTASPTVSASFTATATASPSPTLAASSTASPTPTVSRTWTPVPSDTPTPVKLLLHLLAPNPDPSNGPIYLGYYVSVPCEVDVGVYTVSGELVRTLDPFQAAAGNNEELWDGKNSYGVSVASGIFLYRVLAKSRDGDQKSDISKCAILR